jgi:hypothetical protein
LNGGLAEAVLDCVLDDLRSIGRRERKNTRIKYALIIIGQLLPNVVSRPAYDQLLHQIETVLVEWKEKQALENHIKFVRSVMHELAEGSTLMPMIPPLNEEPTTNEDDPSEPRPEGVYDGAYYGVARNSRV